MAKKANTINLDPSPYLKNKKNGKDQPQIYRKKAAVFVQGAIADAVFYIREGKVKLTVVSDRGKEAVVAILGPGNFVGEGCLVGQPLSMSSATTIERARIIRIEKKAMLALLKQQSDYAQSFINYLLTSRIRVEEDLVDQLFNSSEKRLARLLLQLAHYGKDTKPEPIVPNITQETLAMMVGTTRSRVNGFMNKFRKLGMIDYNGKLYVNQALLSSVLRE